MSHREVISPVGISQELATCASKYRFYLYLQTSKQQYTYSYLHLYAYIRFIQGNNLKLAMKCSKQNASQIGQYQCFRIIRPTHTHTHGESVCLPAGCDTLRHFGVGTKAAAGCGPWKACNRELAARTTRRTMERRKKQHLMNRNDPHPVGLETRIYCTPSIIHRTV